MAKPICIFVIFSVINIYSSVEVIEMLLDNNCLTSSTLNVTAMNQQLTTGGCQLAETEPPIANVDLKREKLCEYLNKRLTCFGQCMRDWELNKCFLSGKKKIFDQMIDIFKAGLKFKCEDKTDLFRSYLTSVGQNCLNSKAAALNVCSNAIEFIEPWVTLETLNVRSEKPHSRSECWQKGLWTYCVNNELNDCAEKTAVHFNRGFYSAMLAASPCKKLIQESFPDLVKAAKVSSPSAIWLNNHFLTFLCFIILISV